MDIKFDANGLAPAIVQDYKTGAVLMLAYMNEESLKRTITEGVTWFYSRSRQRLWQKGEESGNVQRVRDIRVDCDTDTLLILVEQSGVACHTGEYSCFFRGIDDTPRHSDSSPQMLRTLYETIGHRIENPVEGSYTNYLWDKGVDKILKKVGEECAEVIIAAKNASADEVRYEASDLIYHLWVLLHKIGVKPEDLYQELANRHQ